MAMRASPHHSTTPNHASTTPGPGTAPNSARRHRIRLLAAACLTAATVAGTTAACSDSMSNSHSGSTTAAGGAARADNLAPGAGTSGGSQGGAPMAAAPNAAPAKPAPANPAPTDLAVAGRSLVFTATLTIRTKDVQGATGAAEQLALSNGGFVGDEKATSGTVPDVPGITQATVTLRIPSDKFDSVLTQLGTGGTVLAQTRSASDVTTQVVDTTSRISSAEASIARITELMKNANGLTDVVALEGELARREADLDSLKSQLAALQDQVSLSTITVTYQVPEIAPPAPATPKKQNALQRGLHDGWVAFVDVVKVLLIVGGALLPFAIVAAALWWPIRRTLRWRAARAAGPATGPAAAPVTPPRGVSSGDDGGT